MNNKKTTKRALLSSVLSLVLCMAMLIGTTFAWFTDNATSGVNKIQSGKLDIQLLAADGKTSLEGKTLEFVKAEGAESETLLWEPGVTYHTQGFQIKNAGNLYLKFKVVINGITNGNAKLLEAIDFYVASSADATTGIDIDGDKVLAPSAYFDGVSAEGSKNATTLYLIGHMKESAGNEYQNLTLDGLGITVYATQYTSEHDSFNNTYDAAASYADADVWDGVSVAEPQLIDGVYHITSAAELAGLNNVLAEKYVGNPEPHVNVVLDTNIDLAGNEWTPIGATFSNAFKGVFDGQGYFISNVTVTSDSERAALFGNNRGTIKNLTVKNVTISGTEMVGGLVGYSNGGNIINCQVIDGTVTGSDKSIGGIVGYFGGGKIVDSVAQGLVVTGLDRVGALAGRTNANDGATTITDNKALSVYVVSTGGTKASELIGEDYTGTSTVKNNTVTEVTVVTSEEDKEVAAVGTAEDFAELSNSIQDGVIVLTQDIDLGGASVSAIAPSYGGDLVFEGNGHTIYNGSILPGNHNGMQNYGLFYVHTDASLTVNNLTIKDMTVDASVDNYGAAIVVGYSDGNSTVTLNNVDIIDCSVTNTYDEAGVYISYTTGDVYMTDCDSTGCTVQGETTVKTGAFIGHLNGGTATIKKCTTDLTIGLCNRVDGTLKEE